MKQQIFIAIKLTLASIVLFCGLYTGIVWAIAQAAPAKGEGEKIVVDQKVRGYQREGQSFRSDAYFNGRPSACNYDASASVGSNKGPSNPEYLATVSNRIDSFLVHNPSVQRNEIPSEIVTASGSGLDPDLSPAAAYVQVARIASLRKLPKQLLNDLVASHIQQPLFNSFGPEKINVLQLNIDLDHLSSHQSK